MRRPHHSRVFAADVGGRERTCDMGHQYRSTTICPGPTQAFHAPSFELKFHIIKHGWIPAEENRAVSGRQRRLCKFLK